MPSSLLLSWKNHHRRIVVILFILGSLLFNNGNDGIGMLSIVRVESFVLPLQRHHYRQSQQQARLAGGRPAACSQRASSSSSSLAMMSSSSPTGPSAPPRIDISVPSQAQCETLGIREWPQQSKKGSWTERVTSTGDNSSLVRYVLEGSGVLEIVIIDDDDNDDDDDNSNIAKTKQQQQQQQITKKIKPGTLIEIEGNSKSSGVNLQWTCDSNCPEMILLTPNFEEGNVFIGVIAGIVVLFGVLLSGALG